MSLQHAPDLPSIIKIGEITIKLFNGQPLLNAYLGPVIFKICKRTFEDDNGKLYAMRVVRECLAQYTQLEGMKKIPEIAKKQPMYLVQKGNEKYSPEEEHDFLVTDKSGKNIMTLVERAVDLILSAKSDTLNLNLKQELMETNAIIKKSQYRASNKSISNILSKKFGITREEEEQFNEEFRVKKSLASME